jgi:outer membrane immunogenic protein
VGGAFGYATAVAFSNTKSGYTVGGGLEWKLARNWLVRGEYLFYHFVGANAVGTSPVAPLNPSLYTWSDLNVHEGRAGISYQF